MKTFLTKYWKILTLCIFIICGLTYWINHVTTQKKATSITTVKVSRHNFSKSLTSSGKTKAEKSVDLKFQGAGKLAWVGVTEGASVSAYQIIARLDTREVQKNLEKSLRDYSNERNDFDEAGLITYGSRKTDATNNLLNDTIKRLLEKNQWDLEKTVLDVELKQLALEFATLITPISGIITHIDTPVAGVNITPATAVFSVADPKSLVFEANVDETDVGAISIGQNATITLDAYPEASFSGSISYISYISQQSSGGATVFPVKIRFDQPETLRIGLNGDITIVTDQQNDVLTIPTEAIREENGETYVYTKQGTTYKKVPIHTGMKNEDMIIVTSGLSEGDYVVTKGFTNILQ